MYIRTLVIFSEQHPGYEPQDVGYRRSNSSGTSRSSDTQYSDRSPLPHQHQQQHQQQQHQQQQQQPPKQMSSLTNNLSELDQLLQDLNSAKFMEEVDKRDVREWLIN